MELDLEPMTIIVTAAFYIFILILVWKVPFGFTRINEKIIMTIAALPLIYFIVVWQKNR